MIITTTKSFVIVADVDTARPSTQANMTTTTKLARAVMARAVLSAKNKTMARKKSTFKNLDAVPTKIIREVLDSHHCTSIDGRDYGPVREELEEYYWARIAKEDEKALKQFEADQKALFKHQASAHKRK